MWRFLSCFDIFDEPVKLHYKGLPKYSSGFTQVLSILLLVGLLAMIGFYAKDYLNNSSISIYKEDSTISSFSVDPRYADQLQLKIGLRDNMSYQVSPDLLTQLLEVAELALFVCDQPIAYSLSVEPATNLTQLIFNI